ncbi:MAG: sulfotransferase [Parvularculaceae bacterium]|nr:sulfotransferase [Parvularculaceae bacterium]
MSDGRVDIPAQIEALYARGDYQGVIRIAEAAPGSVRGDAGALFWIGLSHALTGAHVRAMTTLKVALDLRPGDPAIMSALARTHLLIGNAAAADLLMARLAASAERDPAFAHHLTEALVQAGRREDAFRNAFSSVERFKNPLLDLGLAETALRTKRIDVGAAAARRAYARLGAVPAVLRVAGAAAIAVGDETWLHEIVGATSKAPDEHAALMFDFWTSVLMSGEQLQAALRAAELAAARTPTAARLRALADLRLAARDIRGAEEAAIAAIARQPNDAAAMTLLARCRMINGDLADAKRILNEAIGKDGDCAVACDYLTQIDPGALTSDMASRLEKLLASGALKADDETKALLALARRDEAIDEHARAFRRIIAAKAVAARTAKTAGAGYDPEATQARLKRMRDIFEGPIAGPPGAIAPQPIFIVGMPRSGTSLVEQILASHEDVYGGGELPGMIGVLNEFAGLAESRERGLAAIKENAGRWRNRLISGLPEEARSRKFFTDKHPLNFWSVGLIRALLPEAKIVNLSRPPVDVCLSILRFRFFGDYDFANEIDSVAHYYSAYTRMTAHWRSLFGEMIHDVEYERLVAAPEPEIRALLSFCGLSFAEQCLAFHETKRAVITHSAPQVREPLNARAIERREKYGDALKPLEDALARFGVAAD